MTSFKSWLIFTGTCFVLVNIYADFLFNELFIMAPLLWLILLIGLLVLLGIAIKRKTIKRYGLLLGVFLLFTFYDLVADDLTEKFKSPIVLRARLTDDLSSVSLLLRQNSQYEVISTSIMGADEKSVGRYKITGSKIQLIDKPEHEPWLPQTLYINKSYITYRFNNSNPDTTWNNSFKIESGSIVNNQTKN